MNRINQFQQKFLPIYIENNYPLVLERERFDYWESEVNRNTPDYIRWVQDSLNKVLGLQLKVDGIMGPQAKSAIRSFQQRQGLVADGVLGPNTESALRTTLVQFQMEPPYTTPALLAPPTEETIKQTIYGWSQYKRQIEELPNDQQAILKNVGDVILTSYKIGGQPVRTVNIYGHADWDTPRNPLREQQMSDKRAQMVTNWLKNYVNGKIASQITWNTRGFGASQLIAQPITEANRRQNRRVVIEMTREMQYCPLSPEKSPELVRWMQSSLNQLLKLSLPTTGIMSTADRSALRLFQSRSGVKPTANLDDQTKQAFVNYGAKIPPCRIGKTYLFTRGDEHNHKPTGRWAEVQKDIIPKCGKLFNQIIRDPAKMLTLPREKAFHCVCAAGAIGGPSIVAKSALNFFRLLRLPTATKHLEHYLAGSGTTINVNLEEIIRRDSKFRVKLASHIKKSRKGFLRIEQRDYSVEDYILALGAIDRLDYEVDAKSGSVHVWFFDRYEWHPVGYGYRRCKGDYLRPSNCIHAAMVEMKSSGAADFWMMGEADIPLSLLR